MRKKELKRVINAWLSMTWRDVAVLYIGSIATFIVVISILYGIEFLIRLVWGS